VATLAVAIQHHPSRQHLLPALLERHAPMQVEVVSDPQPDAYERWEGDDTLSERFGPFSPNSENVRDALVTLLRRYPSAKEHALSVLNRANLLLVDYPVRPEPRYGWGKPPHALLEEIIGRDRERYARTICSFTQYAADLQRIEQEPSSPTAPAWRNRFTSGLDAIALYSFVCERRPGLYIEIGSGNSTKFVRRAIVDHSLQTRIVSIDPHPRAEVDGICDEVIRSPVESVDLTVFDRLGSGDLLYVDNSHRAFMNSDVTVVFVDVLPRLAPGVLVGLDDIYLPFDYPPEWRYRYYSEQYLLASLLLAGGDRLRIELPCAYVGQDRELRDVLRAEILAGLPRGGTSFWVEVAR
jgi:hypothetical protein